MGIRCVIVMPDDQALEKYQALERLGAEVVKVKPAPVGVDGMFVNVARKMALEYDDAMEAAWLSVASADRQGLRPRGFFVDQFENTVNAQTHYRTTAVEIMEQCEADGAAVDVFVCGAGTGGTLAGVAHRLNDDTHGRVRIVLADPEGSGLYGKVKHGVMYDGREREGTRRRSQVDTVVEGIGINRMTRNLSLLFGNGRPSIINDAVRVTDQEAVSMSRHLVANDGLWLGSSSAVNLCAAVRVAREVGEGKRIVTIACDSGARHVGKFWCDAYLSGQGLDVSVPLGLGFLGS